MKAGAGYLREGSVARKTPKPRGRAVFASVLMVFAVLFGFVATGPLVDSFIANSSNGTQGMTEASAMFCQPPSQSLGFNMENPRSWRTGASTYPLDNVSSRTLNAQEVVGNGARFVNFYGFGVPTGTFLFIPEDEGLPQESGKASEDNKDAALDTGVIERVKKISGNSGVAVGDWFEKTNGSRSGTQCAFGSVGTLAANGVLGLTTILTQIMGGISSFAFTPTIICDSSSNSTAPCVDLVGIIGGGNGNPSGGIIGNLTNSIYFPLLVIVGLLVAVWIIINGLVKRQFRETLTGALWCVVVMVAGVALLVNPQMLAKAPMAVGNTIAQCVIGTFTGSAGCGTSGSSAPSTGELCAADTGGSGINKAPLTMANLNCKLWEAFVLQPYAQGSFGLPLEQLYVGSGHSNTEASKIVEKAGLDPNNFCISLKPNGAPSQYANGTLKVSGGSSICNIALYQMLLQVDVQNGSAVDKPNNIDPRWLQLAIFAASDDGTYNAWAPSDFHVGQVGLAGLGLIAAACASLVIVVTSAFALAFFFISIILMAFAPFFLLAGVHPGRGKKIMLGWLGQVLSNLMKFIASAIFLVITVAIYSAVLSSVSNLGAMLIFVIILTVALLMYRREIVDMLGIIDLGGEKLSNKFGEKVMDRVKNTGKTAMAVGAGVTAGALSNGSINPFKPSNWTPGNLKSNLLDNVRAGTDAGRRSIKSRPGALGEVFKASDRISAENKSRVRENKRKADDFASEANRNLVDAQAKEAGIESNIAMVENSSAAKIETLEGNRQEALNRQIAITSAKDEYTEAQAAGLEAISNPEVRELQDLLNQIKDLEINATIAEESGKLEEAAQFREQAENLGARAETIRSELTQDEIDLGQREYRQEVAANVSSDKINSSNVDIYESRVHDVFKDTMATIAGTDYQIIQEKERAQAELNDLSAAKITAADEVEDARTASENAAAAAGYANEVSRNIRPGEVVRTANVRKQEKLISDHQNNRQKDILAEAGVAKSEADNFADLREDADSRADLAVQAGANARVAAMEARENQRATRQEIDARTAQIEDKVFAESSRELQPALTEKWARNGEGWQKEYAAIAEQRMKLTEQDRNISQMEADGASSYDVDVAKQMRNAIQESVNASEVQFKKSTGINAADARTAFNGALREEMASSRPDLLQRHEATVNAQVELETADLRGREAQYEAEFQAQRKIVQDSQVEQRQAAKDGEIFDRAHRKATSAATFAERKTGETPQAGKDADRIQSKTGRKVQSARKLGDKANGNRGLPTGSPTESATQGPQQETTQAPQQSTPVTPEPLIQTRPSKQPQQQAPRATEQPSKRPEHSSPAFPKQPSESKPARPERPSKRPQQQEPQQQAPERPAQTPRATEQPSKRPEHTSPAFPKQPSESKPARRPQLDGEKPVGGKSTNGNRGPLGKDDPLSLNDSNLTNFLDDDIPLPEPDIEDDPYAGFDPDRIPEDPSGFDDIR